MLGNGTSGLDGEGTLRALVETVLEHEPEPTPEWVPPRRVDPLFAQLGGLWHWGNTAYLMTVEDGELRMSLLGFARASTFRLDGPDRLVGLTGYHAAETMRVVRRDDGTISHLDVATFIFTRTPYDPQAPIPGDHPA